MNENGLGSIRTHLANERTFLAYVRTSLAFLAAGAGMIHFFHSLIIHYVGWFLLAAGSFISIIGVVRFIAVKRRIAKAHE
jgi:putative membrane protein